MLQVDPKIIEQMLNENGAPSLSQIEDELYKGTREIPSIFQAWLHLKDNDLNTLARFPVIIRVHGILGVKMRFTLQTAAVFKNLRKGTYHATWEDYGISFGSFEIDEDGQQVHINLPDAPPTTATMH